MSVESTRHLLVLACGVRVGYEAPFRVCPPRTGLWRLGTALGRPQSLF